MTYFCLEYEKHTRYVFFAWTQNHACVSSPRALSLKRFSHRKEPKAYIQPKTY